MSGQYLFIDKHGNGQTMEFIKISNTEYIRKRTSENPPNSGHEKKPKPAAPFEVNIQNYLDKKLKQIQGLSRLELEKLTIGVLSDLIDQHARSDDLLRKFNKAKQELIATKVKYNNLESKISEISSTKTNIRQKFHELEMETNKICCIENNVLHKTPIQFTVQVEQDVDLIDLTGEDESTSSNTVPISEETSTAKEDPATSEIAEEVSSSQSKNKTPLHEVHGTTYEVLESHTSEALQHPAPLPVLPIVYFIAPRSKTMAPAPEIRTYVIQDKVALTWFMQEQDLSAYEQMLVYQVYYYKETSAPPATANWKKLGELTSRPLPMTCLVAKIKVGKYYLAVRGIDMQLRVGPFSSPVSITFT